MCLIDTGCTANVMSKAAFDRLAKRFQDALVAYDSHGILADGSALPIYGKVRLQGSIGGIEFNAEFLVGKIRDDVILGIPFLEDNGCRLTFGQGSIELKGKVVPCTDRSGKFLSAKVHVVAGVSLPPDSEQLVMCRINIAPASAVGIVDGIQSWGDQGVLLASSVCEMNRASEIPVRVLNASAEVVHLKSGCLIGTFESIQADQVLEGAPLAVPGASNHLPHPGTSPNPEVKAMQETHTDLSVPDHLTSLFVQACKGCTSDLQRAKIATLLTTYGDVFSKEDSDVGLTHLVKHSIPMKPGAIPVKQAPRRPGHFKEEEVDRQVNDLEKRGLIEPSSAAWSSPVVLVKRKDGKLRFCIDYRKVNMSTIGDAYPLPRIDESLDALAGSKLFSTLDLLSGYWQIPLDEDARDKSTFVTRNGLWRWRVMPFGLCSAPATFERLMERVLRGLHWKTLLLYLDDVIIFSSDVDSHIERLETVLLRFRGANLKLKPSKCELFRREVRYLGHIVNEAGVSTDPEKVSAVRDWPEPGCVRELQQFLGTVGYYRRFCPNLADLAVPLNHLINKGVKYNFSPECKQAFDALKDRLTTAPILGYPDPSLAYILDTDASAKAIGAVLSQVQSGIERPIAYFSKTMIPAEQNYCVTRRELLAVIEAVKHFRPYLYGHEFTLRTDHASLQWLCQRRDPPGQVARWMETLNEFKYRFEHRAGIRHGNADGLSRRQCGECKHCTPIEEKERQKAIRLVGAQAVPLAPLDVPPSTCRPISSETLGQRNCCEMGELQNATGLVGEQAGPMAPPDLPPSTCRLTALQQHGSEMGELQRVAGDVATIYRAVKLGKLDLEPQTIQLGSPELKKLASMITLMHINGEGTLMVRAKVNHRFKNVTVCPLSIRQTVMWECHRAAHLGIMKTIRRLRNMWYWPGLTAHVRRVIRSCEVCQVAKTSRKSKSKEVQRLYSGRPWQKVAIDLVGPLPATELGNRWILVLTDHFSRWQDAIPLPDATASTVAEALDHRIFAYNGLPESIHSDQGSQFQGALMTELCKLWKIDKSRSTPYHPEGNGVVERGNRTMGDSLRSLLLDSGEDEWDRLLPHIMRVFRATPHSSTGESPNFMMFGRELRLPDQLVHETTAASIQSPVKYVIEKERLLQLAHELVRSDQRRILTEDSEEPPLFKIGDSVLLLSKKKKKGESKKLQPRYVGPYTITQAWANHTYRVEKGRKSSVENEVRLKLHRPCPTRIGQAPPLDENNPVPREPAAPVVPRPQGQSHADSTVSKPVESPCTIDDGKDTANTPNSCTALPGAAVQPKTTRTRTIRPPKHLADYVCPFFLQFLYCT